MAEAHQFWDKIAARYAEKSVDDPESYQFKLDKTQTYFRSDMNLFEFGCGTGSTAIIHAPLVKHITAIDFSESMLGYARSKASNAGIDNIQFEKYSIDNYPYTKNSIDMVLGLSVLHLLEDRDIAISRVYDMLTPGGYFVSSTPCIADSMKSFKWIAGIGLRLGLLPLLRVFTLDELLESMVKAGFGIEFQWQPGKGKAIYIIAKKTG